MKGKAVTLRVRFWWWVLYRFGVESALRNLPWWAKALRAVLNPVQYWRLHRS